MARTKNIKSISFTDEYKEEYEYVMSIKNASKYVCELIRNDMKSKEDDVALLRVQLVEMMSRLCELEQKK